jgi:MoxR-like ATPase
MGGSTEIIRRLEDSVGRALVGKPEVVRLAVIGLVARGHLLIEDVPGVGKTTLAAALARSIGASFQRIQFTSDMLPSDVLGVSVWEPKTGDFVFKPGPLFTNIVLADEINRTPPKTQAALLQAMQEQRVSAGGQTHVLAPPFLVFATQNPIEQEGTYPLPEAQLDRFMFQVDVGYPSADEEIAIVKQQTSAYRPVTKKVLSPERILNLQELVLRVPVADHVVRYAVALVRATRPADSSLPFIKENVAFGAGPRASQYLILGAKAKAILEGRPAAAVEDVRALAHPTLQHRMITNFHAEAEGIKTRALIDRLLASVRP